MKQSKTKSKNDWQSKPVSNLVRFVSSGVLSARIRVKGKLIRRVLKTMVLSVARLRLADLKKPNGRWPNMQMRLLKFRQWKSKLKLNCAGAAADGESVMLVYLWVALGGAIGSMARYGLGGLVAQKFGESFPFGTLAVNIAGSFVIGFLGALASSEGRLAPQSRVFAMQFLITGVCGGFTTFSSFSLQTLNLIRDREWLYAGGNILLSVALCMIAVWLGFMLGAMLNSMKGN